MIVSGGHVRAGTGSQWLLATHEIAQDRHDPVRRLLGNKVSTVRELVDLDIRENGTPLIEFLPPERDVAKSPEGQRGLIYESLAIIPDRSEPAAGADDVAR